MRVFLDANVLFSAAARQSVVDRLLNEASSRLTLVTCDFALEEARRNLATSRPAWLSHFDQRADAIVVTSTCAFKLPVLLASKDIPIPCSAIRANCRCLVTGDRQDFGHLFGSRVLGVEVMSLSQFAKFLVHLREPP